MKKPIVILENGGSTIKVGLANRGRGKDPRYARRGIECFLLEFADLKGAFRFYRIIQNAVIRSKGDKVTYIGHEFEACQDFASLHYRLPFEKVGEQSNRIAEAEMKRLLGVCRRLGRPKGSLGRDIL
jgi:actin-related protein 6